MLASGTYTLLGIGGPTGLVGTGFFTEKYWHELIHASICEKQVWGLRHKGRRGNNGVILRLKIIKEVLPDLTASAFSELAHFCVGTRLMV
jgi:hypothetical protein